MKRRRYDSKFKTKVVLAALSERHSIQELGTKYELHPNVISKWKREFLSKVDQVFDGPAPQNDGSEDVDKLYKVIGEQKVEIDFVKKALS